MPALAWCSLSSLLVPGFPLHPRVSARWPPSARPNTPSRPRKGLSSGPGGLTPLGISLFQVHLPCPLGNKLIN